MPCVTFPKSVNKTDFMEQNSRWERIAVLVVLVVRFPDEL